VCPGCLSREFTLVTCCTICFRHWVTEAAKWSHSSYWLVLEMFNTIIDFLDIIVLFWSGDMD
jgi:hypothetical protein